MKHGNFAAPSAVVIICMLGGTANAAPPASCAGKFIGVWNHGNNNIGTLTAGGAATCSANPFCQQGTWSCSGNTLVYTNSTGTYNYTLQPNGTMTYGSIVVTRIGRAPANAQSASTPAKASVATPSGQQVKPARQTRTASVSTDCSDVSGKINGRELSRQPCPADPTAKATAKPLLQAKIQPKKPSAIESIAEVDPKFGTALDDAKRVLNSPTMVINDDRARREADSTPSKTAAANTQPAYQSAPPTAVATSESDASLSDNERTADDYAEECRNESIEQGLKSLRQDIRKATEAVTAVDDRFSAIAAIRRTLETYREKGPLIRKVLNKCLRDTLDKNVLQKLYAIGLFSDLATVDDR